VLLVQPELSIVEIVKVQDVVERSANSVSSRVPKYEPAARAGVTASASASAEPSDDKGTLGHACLPASITTLCDSVVLVSKELLTLSRLRMAQGNKTAGGSRAQHFAPQTSLTACKIAIVA
jgi:hypothetical protein